MATKDLTWYLSSPKRAYHYARDVIEGRWPEGEALIAQDVHYAYLYAYAIIKDRFPEGEAVIAQNLNYAYRYARWVIEGRFIEGEAAIIQDPKCAADYYLALDYYNRFKDQFTEHEQVLWLLKI